MTVLIPEALVMVLTVLIVVGIGSIMLKLSKDDENEVIEESYLFAHGWREPHSADRMPPKPSPRKIGHGLQPTMPAEEVTKPPSPAHKTRPIEIIVTIRHEK